MQLIVTAKKLNKRQNVPATFADDNIIGIVLQGFRFEGIEIPNSVNAALGKWYADRDGSCYWGGGLVVEVIPAPAPVHTTLLLKPTGVNGDIINIPDDAAIGMDLSHHNGMVDWEAVVNAGIKFTFIKISEGVGTPDPRANLNAIDARTAGLKIGYYHFCRPDKRNGGTVISDATAEADEAMSIIATLPKPDLPLVLDLEDAPGWDTPLAAADYMLWIKTFLDRIKSKSALITMIYSRKNYLDVKLPATHTLGTTKLWLANYATTDCNAVHCPVGWNEWSVWQYSEKAVIGKNGELDLNIMKDSTMLM